MALMRSQIITRLRIASEQTEDFYYRLKGILKFQPLFLKKTLATCPVCNHYQAYILPYPAFKTPLKKLPPHDKYLCSYCGHVYTRWLSQSVNQIGQIYSACYDQKEQRKINANPRKTAQKKLLLLLAKKTKKQGCYLDFACGDNFSIAADLRKEGLKVWACEIRNKYPYDNKVFFRYNPSKPFKKKLAGIASLDAIEHIQTIKKTWRFFNLSLKKNGLMVHSFPTAFRYHYYHRFFRIPFHACLFSRKSLLLWSKKMGFKYLGEEALPESDVGVCYWFKKVKSLKE